MQSNLREVEIAENPFDDVMVTFRREIGRHSDKKFDAAYDDWMRVRDRMLQMASPIFGVDIEGESQIADFLHAVFHVGWSMEFEKDRKAKPKPSAK